MAGFYRYHRVLAALVAARARFQAAFLPPTGKGGIPSGDANQSKSNGASVKKNAGQFATAGLRG